MKKCVLSLVLILCLLLPTFVMAEEMLGVFLQTDIWPNSNFGRYYLEFMGPYNNWATYEIRPYTSVVVDGKTYKFEIFGDADALHQTFRTAIPMGKLCKIGGSSNIIRRIDFLKNPSVYKGCRYQESSESFDCAADTKNLPIFCKIGETYISNPALTDEYVYDLEVYEEAVLITDYRPAAAGRYWAVLFFLDDYDVEVRFVKDGAGIERVDYPKLYSGAYWEHKDTSCVTQDMILHTKYLTKNAQIAAFWKECSRAADGGADVQIGIDCILKECVAQTAVYSEKGRLLTVVQTSVLPETEQFDVHIPAEYVRGKVLVKTIFLENNSTLKPVGEPVAGTI